MKLERHSKIVELIGKYNIETQEELAEYLNKEGYNVTMVHDGGAALAEFDKLHPDHVLLDVMMPVMDGWEVCRKLRAKDNTPIIMLTAKGETYDKVTADIARAPYSIVRGDNNTPRVDIDGRLSTPQEISAIILQKMKKKDEDYLGQEVTEAVITVPA